MYQNAKDTDSTLAAYLADGAEALMLKWSRAYAITYVAPNSYGIDPNVAPRDKRPIILMGSIIYKMGNVRLASFRDQDFSYNPSQVMNPIQQDIVELEKYLPKAQLAKAVSAPMRGYNNMINPESFNRILFGSLSTTGNNTGADGLVNGGADWEWYNLI
jgi:hypothetical protein